MGGAVTAVRGVLSHVYTGATTWSAVVAVSVVADIAGVDTRSVITISSVSVNIGKFATVNIKEAVRKVGVGGNVPEADISDGTYHRGCRWLCCC